MNTLVRNLVILVVGVGLLAVAWYLMLPWASVRYRLIIEAEAGGRPLTGSGVVEVRYRKEPAWLVGRQSSEAVHGQSVWVDIPGEGPIFALLSSEPPGGRYSQFPEIVFQFDDVDRVSRFLALSRLEGRRELPADKWPMFARFQNLRDPATVEGIDTDELALGTSPLTTARVNRIWIEITRDPVTTGIDEMLPAMAVMRASKRVSVSANEIPRPGRRKVTVSASHFSRGVSP